MEYTAFIRSATGGRPPSLTLIHGGDAQLLDDALAAATRGLFPDATQITLGEDAARLLVQWVGDDSAALLGEARKAALAGGARNTTIGVKDVTAVVGEHRVSGVFDLTRAVQRREVGAALRTLDRLLAGEE